jgi:hypothetical protein
MVTASRLDSPVLASKGKEKKGNLDAQAGAIKALTTVNRLAARPE